MEHHWLVIVVPAVDLLIAHRDIRVVWTHGNRAMPVLSTTKATFDDSSVCTFNTFIVGLLNHRWKTCGHNNDDVVGSTVRTRRDAAVTLQYFSRLVRGPLGLRQRCANCVGIRRNHYGWRILVPALLGTENAAGLPRVGNTCGGSGKYVSSAI